MGFAVKDVRRIWAGHYSTALRALTGYGRLRDAERYASNFYDAARAAADAADVMTKRHPGMTVEAWHQFTNERARSGGRPEWKRGEKLPRSVRRLVATVPPTTLDV